MRTFSNRFENEAEAHAPGTGWEIFWGSLLIVSGALAVMMPGVAAQATALTLALLLIFCGAFEIADSFQTRRNGGFGWKLGSGVLTLVLGAALLLMPLAGVVSLALLVGGFLCAAGVARAMLALRLRRRKGSGWVLFDGLLAISVAVFMLVGWPEDSPASIGLLTGFTLITTGLWRIIMRRELV